MRLIIFLICLVTRTPVLANSSQNLPSLGDSASGIVSLGQEREIGQNFLRSLRAQAPTVSDPVVQEYVEHLTYRLVAKSELKDRRIDIVIVRSPVLNAFAVPGGVIGINHGLFFYAESEHEVAAILAHEIAHISQRHFARGVEASREAGVINVAGILGSIILATTVGSDAGMAALNTVLGANQAEQLKYSRGREAEADRVGINTLAAAGMDPRAMAYSFERMERANRYNVETMPDFLRTHPVAADRVIDAYNQAGNHPQKAFPTSIDFQMMKARVRAITSDNPAELTPVFRAGLTAKDPVLREANAYGLALVLTRMAAFDEATEVLRPLLTAYPTRIPLLVAEADIHMKAERYDRAIELLETALALSPGNYPLTMLYAQALTNVGQAVKAQGLLVTLSSERSNDDYVWYHLAEVAGAANDIPGVHWARAEYFVLHGNYDQALKQLEYGMPLVKQNFQREAKFRQRMADIWELKSKV